MKMRGFRVLPAVLLLTLSLFAPGRCAEKQSESGAHHSLWKVDGKKNTIYLLGSIHVLKKEDYPLPAPIEAAYTNSQILFFEADLDAAKEPAVALKIQSKMMLPEGETLKDYLSEETFGKLNDHLKEVGLPAVMFERLKPAMAATMMEVMELQKLGFVPQYGLDEHFYRRAKKDDKEIVAFETVEFQLDLLGGFSKAESEVFIKSTLRDIDKLKQEFADLIKAWKTGDSDALAKMLNEASEESPALFKRLVADRNQSWLARIQEAAAGDKNALIVVGAGHLVGNDTLVALLKKRGYKVTQL